MSAATCCGMFEDYKRECPRCHAELHGQAVFCKSCKKLLPWRLSRTRRIVDGSFIVIAVIAVTVAILAPDFVRDLVGMTSPKVAAAVSAPSWPFAGKPPAQREWAWRVEQSLSSACSANYQRYADKRIVVATLGQFLPQVQKDLGEPLTPETARLSEDEKSEALTLLNAEGPFIEKCLRASYEAIQSCEKFKDELAGKPAADCMVNAVGQTMAAAPYKWCVKFAVSQRLKGACTYAADQAEHSAVK